MDDLRDALARLDARFETLELRVAQLEGRQPEAPPVPRANSAEISDSEAALAQPPILAPAENIFSVAGRSMLGIAGAYVLRASAESGSFPRLAVVVLALVYAGTWLVWAARAAPAARFTRFAYALTASLILVPMLAELTLRLQVLPDAVTAALLSTFVIGAFSLAWKRCLASIAWVATGAALATALGLLIVSRDLAPYVAALLVMAAASEIAAAAGRWKALRFAVFPAAVIATLILIYIQSLPASSRPDYPSVSTSVVLALTTLLFVIYGASTAYSTILQRRAMSIFALVQGVTTFLLAAVSCLWLAPGGGHIALGCFCWIMAAACYAAAFFRFDRVADAHNYHVYSTWSVALVMAGSFLLLAPTAQALFLSALAIAATVAGVRIARLTLEFHGLVYLTGAAFASSLLIYAARALAGTFPTAPGWLVWVVAVAALVCYAIGGRFQGDLWNHKLMRVLSAALAVSAVATFLVSSLVWLAASGMTLGASHVAVIRTLITCALALALAFGGSRWGRSELVWTAYGTLAFVTAKLIFEDLPHSHSGPIAISIFLYAVSLMLIPRLARTKTQS